LLNLQVHHGGAGTTATGLKAGVKIYAGALHFAFGSLMANLPQSFFWILFI